MDKWLNLMTFKVNGKELKFTEKDRFDSFNRISFVKSQTKNTPTILDDEVIFKIQNKKEFPPNLNASALLAEYLTGVDKCVIVNSDLEKAFVEANQDDFVKFGKIKCQNKKYTNYEYDKISSDGNIIMPTSQRYGEKEIFVINGQAFDRYGEKVDIKITK